jgi:hypothetical protein
MAGEVPDHLDLGVHRDWEGRRFEQWLPRTLFLLLCLIPLLALFNVFGQGPKSNTVANPNGVASMTLRAPTSIRSGLLFEARFDIDVKKEIKDAVLVLDPGWNEQLTLNTMSPGASSETSKNGSLALDLGAIPAGKRWRQYLQFQANPVNMGRQSQGVTLFDGNVPLLHMNRDVMVWP